MLSICFWISFFPCKNKELQEKANEYFEEITQLAKSNSPAFFARFQEIYPNFVSEILKAEPKFRVSELTLCAFIYLGFKTKEIVEYTSTSIYTVKSRKTNLKKTECACKRKFWCLDEEFGWQIKNPADKSRILYYNYFRLCFNFSICSLQQKFVD